MHRIRSHNRHLLAVAVTLAVCSSNCASFAHGSMQQIAIDSEPPGARVFIGEKDVGRTPVSVWVSRHNRRPVLRFEKEGFAPHVVEVRRSTSNWIAADVAVCLNPMAIQGMDSTSQYPPFVAMCTAQLIGFDLITGAAFKFQSRVDVILVPAADHPPSAERTGAQPTVIRLGS